ncbi:hypothetical protein [Sphingomonas paucimobilis]|uniref:hypothetical protein n=1 Tax=Sphingomonas paucimobilis TaxID=13689 RepID=UPI0031E1387F
MGHAKIHRQQMLDWIERCANEGVAVPDDAAICHAFGFSSTEHARTLLAELADAGSITVQGGYGADRRILLGRVRSGASTAARPMPSVVKDDPVVGQAVAKIMAIAKRPSPPPAASPAAPSKVEPMTKTLSKSVTVVVSGEVLEELKRRTADGTPYNRATLELLDQALGKGAAAPVAQLVPALEDIDAHELVSELARRLAEDRPNAALAQAEEQLRMTAEQAAALEQRAVAAEEALAKVRSAVGL